MAPRGVEPALDEPYAPGAPVCRLHGADRVRIDRFCAYFLKLAPELLAVVEPVRTPEQAELVRSALSISDPAQLVGLLVRLTAPGEELDPAVAGADVLWADVILHLYELDPDVASRTARRWAGRLMALQFEDIKVHPVVEAVAHYCCAWVEISSGRTAAGRRFARSATVFTDFEDEGLLSMATYVRALRLMGMPRGW